jgi:spermidine/putrescine transport system ATP-binding protein
MNESPMIVLDDISKAFGEVRAVDSVALQIGAGEFFSLLGPSGCGKTTTLRMIAGFEEPDVGRIVLEGADVTFTPPPKRNVNMVFQDYALFPHMTVAENVAFGLKLKKVSGAESRERARAMLATMQLEGLEDRRPAQLSGGQRQRVALARALVNEPAALLLDEPLGALDLKLRKEMQLELSAIQREVGTTFVYVTHDQEEALTMSDRIAVMCDGVVEQVASPRELYEFPRTRFVADFIGISNLLELRVDRREGGVVAMELGDGMRIVAPDPGPGPTHTITVRPEKITVGEGGGGDSGSRVRGRVVKHVYLGSITQLVVRLASGDQLAVHLLNDDRAPAGIDPGADVELSWPLSHSFVIGASGAEPAHQGDTEAPELPAGEPRIEVA